MFVFGVSFYAFPYIPAQARSVCLPLSAGQISADATTFSRSASSADYDDQLWLGFFQNFTSIQYNVTAVAQTDSFGFGPAYFLNGLTDKDMYYQIGVSWNFRVRGEPDFEMVYQVWNATSRMPVYPSSNGSIARVKLPEIKDGGVVLLSLSFSNDTVVMKAYDWGSKTTRSASFGAFGASQFAYYFERPSHFRSSLLTEWYHVLPYTCTDSRVVYSNTRHKLLFGWLNEDIWNFTGAAPTNWFTCGSQCVLQPSHATNLDFFNNNTLLFHKGYTAIIFANSTMFITP